MASFDARLNMCSEILNSYWGPCSVAAACSIFIILTVSIFSRFCCWSRTIFIFRILLPGIHVLMSSLWLAMPFQKFNLLILVSALKKYVETHSWIGQHSRGRIVWNLFAASLWRGCPHLVRARFRTHINYSFEYVSVNYVGCCTNRCVPRSLSARADDRWPIGIPGQTARPHPVCVFRSILRANNKNIKEGAA